MSQFLAGNDAPADEVDHLGKLQDDINCDICEPLKYVRHLRNKWAAHPSLDRHFDDWADADKSLSIATVEAALVRLVDNARDTAVFVYSSPALRDFCRSPVAENRDRSMTAELDLRDVDSWAATMRESIGHDVRALRAQITGLTKVERMFRTEGYRGKRY